MLLYVQLWLPIPKPHQFLSGNYLINPVFVLAVSVFPHFHFRPQVLVKSKAQHLE